MCAGLPWWRSTPNAAVSVDTHEWLSLAWHTNRVREEVALLVQRYAKVDVSGDTLPVRLVGEAQTLSSCPNCKLLPTV